VDRRPTGNSDIDDDCYSERRGRDFTVSLTSEMFRTNAKIAKIAPLCLLLLICAAPSFAQQATPRDQRPLSDDSLEHLSRNRYSSRQQATMEMWRQREASREQVQEAARHPDPEVSGRAKWILRQWRRGSLPGAPPEVSRLLQQTDGPLAIQRLLERGQFRAAVVAVEESAGTADPKALQARITAALLQRFPVYVHRAIGSDSLNDLLKLVDLVADSKEMAVCRVQMMQQLGIEVTGDSLLPNSAVSWDPVERDRAAALVLLTLGQTDAALEVAARSADKELLYKYRMIGARWAEIARDGLQAARQTEPGGYEHTRLWCDIMIAADRTGDSELFKQAVEQVSASNEADDTALQQLRWKVLAIHGEIDAALETLDRVSPQSSANLAIDVSRTGRAFDVLGFPLERVDTEIGQWVDDAIEVQRASKSNDLVGEIRTLFSLLQCLLSIGRDDAAWYIVKRLSDSDVHINELRLREYVLWQLMSTKRADWVVQLSVGEGEKALSQYSRQSLAGTLPEADARTFEIVMGAMQMLQHEMPLKQRVLATHQLLSGELPDFFDPDEDFDLLYQYVTGTPQVPPIRSRTIQIRGALINLDIVSLFAQHGESELAAAALQKLAQSGDVEALFQLAEQELDGGRAESSLALFQTVLKTIESQGSVVSRFGGGDEVAFTVKSLIGLWTIARRGGDDQLSAELLQEIRLCLCSPSTQLRKTVADYLANREESLLAMEAYEALLPMTVMGTQDNTGLYDVARGYALLARKTNTAEAARWFDLAIAATLETMTYRPGAYVTLPLYARRWWIEAAIEQNDAAAAEVHLKRILKLDPLDIDFAERLLPEMRKAGMEDLADLAIDQIMSQGIDYAEQFPFDAMTCNNLAWVAAMNKRHLEDALRLSELAVYVEPQSAIYRDTLAEVLFQLDRKTEALQIEQGCLLDDPTQWHLHQQVKKYSEAIESDGS
jgi:tetratricopeptide (TPR) repeat protein